MSVTIPARFKEMRGGVPFDGVKIGYASIHLSPAGELEAAQKGYGVIPEGDTTDWLDEWVVIGYEGMCGDPIFVDTDDDEYPVYTAAHGMGEWKPQLIAFSFRHFVQILQRLQLLARERSNPAEMKRHPILNRERDDFIEFIRRQSPTIDFDFWKLLFETEA